jgi:hypothetical protein
MGESATRGVNWVISDAPSFSGGGIASQRSVGYPITFS